MAEVRAQPTYVFIPVCQFCLHPDDTLTSVDNLYCSDKCKESDAAHSPMTQHFRTTASRMVTFMKADARFNTRLAKYIKGEQIYDLADIAGLTPDQLKKPYLFDFEGGRLFSTYNQDSFADVLLFANVLLKDDFERMKEYVARVKTLMGRIGEDLTTILVSTITAGQFGLFLFKAKLLDIEKKEN